jgi:hypothetical protein
MKHKIEFYKTEDLTIMHLMTHNHGRHTIPQPLSRYKAAQLFLQTFVLTTWSHFILQLNAPNPHSPSHCEIFYLSTSLFRLIIFVWCGARILSPYDWWWRCSEAGPFGVRRKISPYCSQALNSRYEGRGEALSLTHETQILWSLSPVLMNTLKLCRLSLKCAEQEDMRSCNIWPQVERQAILCMQWP